MWAPRLHHAAVVRSQRHHEGPVLRPPRRGGHGERPKQAVRPRRLHNSAVVRRGRHQEGTGGRLRGHRGKENGLAFFMHKSLSISLSLSRARSLFASMAFSAECMYVLPEAFHGLSLRPCVPPPWALENYPPSAGLRLLLV